MRILAIISGEYGVWEGPIPPPFPSGKGACCVVGLVIFLVNVSFDEGSGPSPLGDREASRSVVEGGGGGVLG